MAKSKRKPSATQKDKYWIQVAKRLKENGIISKQAKLHGGKFISKEVLKKAKQFEHTALLNYKTVKVSKSVAQAAKDRGFQVVAGNKIIGPKDPKFRNRLKSGAITGVKPVKGGMMEEVILPHTIYDMRTLMETLEDGGLDSLKLTNEQFAFKYKGNESYRAFMNGQQLLEHLRHYKGVNSAIMSNKAEDLQEEFDAFTIFRLHPSFRGMNLPSVEERAKRRAARRAQAIRDGKYIVRKRRGKTRADRLDNMPEWRVNKILDKAAEYDRKRRAKLQENPAKLQEYRDKAKARAKASRDAKKG